MSLGSLDFILRVLGPQGGLEGRIVVAVVHFRKVPSVQGPQVGGWAVSQRQGSQWGWG